MQLIHSPGHRLTVRPTVNFFLKMIKLFFYHNNFFFTYGEFIKRCNVTFHYLKILPYMKNDFLFL